MEALREGDARPELLKRSWNRGSLALQADQQIDKKYQRCAAKRVAGQNSIIYSLISGRDETPVRLHRPSLKLHFMSTKIVTSEADEVGVENKGPLGGLDDEPRS